MSTNSSSEQQLEQLQTLRSTLQTTTLDYLRTELAKTLPTDQVNRILNHENVGLELNSLVQRVSLESHANLDSLSFRMAQELTRIAEPHVRLAIGIAHPTLKPEDVLQEVIRSNTNVSTAYQPLSDSLKPAAPDSPVSRLHQQIASPLVNGPKNLPTIEPEVNRLVPDQQIAPVLHQELLADLLTHHPTDTANLVEARLASHGIKTIDINPQALDHFVDYLNKYHEVISLDPDIAHLQKVAEANKLTGDQLQQVLQQTGQTPEQLIQEIATTPDSPTEVSLGQTKAGEPHEPFEPYEPPKSINQAIKSADRYRYLDSSPSQSSFGIRQIIQFLRRYLSQQSSPNVNIFQRIFNFSQGSPVGGGSFGGPSGAPPFNSSFGSSIGDFAKQGLSQAGQSIGNAAKEGVKAAARAAIKAAKTALKAVGEAAAKSLLANPYFWAVVIGIIILVAILYIAAGASPQKVALMQADSIGGKGGSSEPGTGFCDPTADPTKCTPLFCQGTCTCPASGPITQGPNGPFSHQSTNAIDIGYNTGTPVYSISDGVVSFAGFSLVGYGNLVIVSNPDGTQLYYGHLESYFVTAGQTVTVREQLGTGDDTGNSFGSHLHLEYRGAGAQNILNLFNFTPDQINLLNGCAIGSSNNCGGIWCSN